MRLELALAVFKCRFGPPSICDRIPSTRTQSVVTDSVRCWIDCHQCRNERSNDCRLFTSISSLSPRLQLYPTPRHSRCIRVLTGTNCLDKRPARSIELSNQSRIASDEQESDQLTASCAFDRTALAAGLAKPERELGETEGNRLVRAQLGRFLASGAGDGLRCESADASASEDAICRARI